MNRRKVILLRRTVSLLMSIVMLLAVMTTQAFAEEKENVAGAGVGQSDDFAELIIFDRVLTTAPPTVRLGKVTFFCRRSAVEVKLGDCNIRGLAHKKCKK